jgi:Dolichyl-phosphate-mannose-protein mannosyltransferase
VRDRIRLALSAATFALHLAVANRYDFFRDELYFIGCGRHPAWGYVDEPPLVPLLSAATQVWGEQLWLLRCLACLAAAGTVYTTVALARLLGAGSFGALLAGAAAAIAPMYLGLMMTVGTSTFEPFLWTLLAWLVTRAVLERQPGWFVWAGAVAGVDLELKYELPLFLIPLLGALLVTGRAGALRCWQFAVGAGLAVVLAAPSAIWQLAHGLPFLELLHNQRSEGKNVALAPLAFLGQQLLVMNPLLAPVWLAGVLGPWLGPRLKPARHLSLAFLVPLLVMLALQAKDYFAAPLYGSMFAVGAVAWEPLVSRSWARGAYLLTCLAFSALVAPLALPILPPSELAAYLAWLPLRPRPSETLRQSQLPQTFADMFGWREMTAKVREAVDQLSSEDRARTVILAHNYGEAAAFEFYGRGLPPVVSGHNQYYLWGLQGQAADLVLAFNRDENELRKACAEVHELAHFYAPWVMPFEDDSAITLCRHPTPSLAERWPSLKLYY